MNLFPKRCCVICNKLNHFATNGNSHTVINLNTPTTNHTQNSAKGPAPIAKRARMAILLLELQAMWRAVFFSGRLKASTQVWSFAKGIKAVHNFT